MSQPEHPLVTLAVELATRFNRLTESQVRAVLRARYDLVSAPGLDPTHIPEVVRGLTPGVTDYGVVEQRLRSTARANGFDSRSLLEILEGVPALEDLALITVAGELEELVDRAALALNDRLDAHARLTGRPPADVRAEFDRLYGLASPRSEDSMSSDVTDWLDGAPADHTIDALRILARREPLTRSAPDGRRFCAGCGAAVIALHRCGAEFDRELVPCPADSIAADLSGSGHRIRTVDPRWLTSVLDDAEGPVLFPLTSVTDETRPVAPGAGEGKPPPLPEMVSGQLAAVVADTGDRLLVRPVTLRCSCRGYGADFSCGHITTAVSVVQRSLSEAFTERNREIGAVAEQYRRQQLVRATARERTEPSPSAPEPAGYLDNPDAFAQDWHDSIAAFHETGIAVPFRPEGLPDTSGRTHGQEIEFGLTTPRDPGLPDLADGDHDERLDAIAAQLHAAGLLSKPYVEEPYEVRKRPYPETLAGGFLLVTDDTLDDRSAEFIKPRTAVNSSEYWGYLARGLDIIVAGGGTPTDLTALQNWFGVPEWAGVPEYVTRACELARDSHRDRLRMGVNPRLDRVLVNAKRLPAPPSWGYASIEEARHAHELFELRHGYQYLGAKEFELNIGFVGATPADAPGSRVETRTDDATFELGVIQASVLHGDAFVTRAPHYRRGLLPAVSPTPVELLDDLDPEDPRFAAETEAARAYIDFLIPEAERVADRKMLVALYATRPYRMPDTVSRPASRQVRGAPRLADPLGRAGGGRRSRPGL